jgi:hypothetical protein
MVASGTPTSSTAARRIRTRKALLSAIPVPDPTVRRERIVLKGDQPSPADRERKNT